MLLFVCSEAVEASLVKLETSHIVILPLYGEGSMARDNKLFQILNFGKI